MTEAKKTRLERVLFGAEHINLFDDAEQYLCNGYELNAVNKELHDLAVSESELKDALREIAGYRDRHKGSIWAILHPRRMARNILSSKYLWEGV